MLLFYLDLNADIATIFLEVMAYVELSYDVHHSSQLLTPFPFLINMFRKDSKAGLFTFTVC